MNRNKRLMVVIWHLGIGGMQKRLRDIVEEINKKYPNWQVKVVVKYKKSEIVGITGVEYLANDKRNGNSLSSVFKIIKIYWEYKPDVVLTFLDHLSVLMVLLKKIIFWRKVKIVLNESMVTSVYLRMSRGWSAKIWGFMIKIFYPMADVIIVPTVAIKRDLKNNFGIINKIIVIPNWTLIKKNEFYQKKKWGIIYVGRLEKEKGVELLIKITNQLKQKILVIGEGRLEKQLKKNKRLVILKTLEHKKIESYIEQSKLLVLPSLNEGMPNVVLEAGIIGVPTVARNFLGASEIINDGIDGMIGENDSDLVDKIKYLLDNEEIRKSMGQRMREKVKKKFGYQLQSKFVKILVNSRA